MRSELQSPTSDIQPGSSHRDVLDIILGFGSFTALVVVVPALILAEGNSGRSSAWLVTMLILAISGTRLAVLIASGQRRMFEFIFWVFCYVFFGLAPSVQLRSGDMPTTTQDLDPVLDLPTAVLALVGVLSFAIGFAIAARMRDPRERAHADSVNVTRLTILTVVSLASAAYYVGKIGVGVLLSSRAEFAAVENEIWPDPATDALIAAVSAFPIVVAAHGWWSVARVSERKQLPRLIAIVLTTISLAVTNPISSARYHFGVVWGSFLGPAGAYATRRRTSLTMVGIVLGLLFLFPIADLFRRQDVVNASRSSFLSEYAGNGDYDAFGQLSNALLYTATMPFEFARQFLGVVLFWVPRSLWADKPGGTGVVLAEFRGYRFTNLSAPIWAEMLLSFGLIGVVVASILFGILLGRLDKRFLHGGMSGVNAIAGSVLPFYLLILMRGSLLQATGILIVLIGSMLFIADWSGGRGTTAGAKAPPNGRQSIS
ncbi:hypothetical protein [Leifsonia sp. Leaf264]|uniref:hypothetical protein n=1 Tax=Leifsonia sp. Leaf264 TaxID=1736314 RepID=UPI000B11486A|nr:hypothetical protein [Leifsonia sp. Leaf264]